MNKAHKHLATVLLSLRAAERSGAEHGHDIEALDAAMCEVDHLLTIARMSLELSKLSVQDSVDRIKINVLQGTLSALTKFALEEDGNDKP